MLNRQNIFVSAFILLVFCFITTTESKAQPQRASLEEMLHSLESFPSYDSVNEVFLNRYMPMDSQFIQFARKVDGWYIYISNIKTPEDFYIQKLYWSYDLKAFRFIPLPLAGNFDHQVNPAIFKVNALRKAFKIHPLYGYEGWDEDMIKFFGDFKQSPDSILYSLAKANSNLALSYIRRPQGYQWYKRKKAKYEGGGIDKFIEYSQKSLITYQKLLNQNKYFSTSDGYIFTKYCNEVMHIFQVLESEGEHKKAKQILDNNKLYTPFLISVSKNFLNSCAPNALLFTNGDNDSYPLWYVQEKFNFRKDVIVVNQNLLNAKWYVNFLKEEYKETVLTTINDTLIDEDRLGHVFILDNDSVVDTKNPQYLNKMLHFVMDNSEETKFKSDLFYVDYMPTTHLKLAVDKENVTAYPSLDSLYCSLILDEINWKLEAYTLSRSQLIALDIIQKNNWKRPIYFTMTSSKANLLGLDNYLRSDGLCLHLIPAEFPRKQNDMQGMGFADGNINYVLFFKYFDWSGINQEDLDKKTKDKMSSLYKNIIARSAVNLIGNKEEVKAKQTTDLVMKHFMPEYVSPDYFTIPIAELFYYFKDIENANSILKTIAVYYDAELQKNSLNDEERASYQQYLQLLVNISSSHKQLKLSNEIQKKINALNK